MTETSNGTQTQTVRGMVITGQIATLAVALAKAQGAIKSAEKDRTNPHFKAKYATLDAVWEACRGALSSNGLSIVQLPEVDGQTVIVRTLLLHASGEYISAALAIKARDDSPQAIGSALTYGRRYGLCAMVGVTADEDDDANGASQRSSHSYQRREPEPVDNRPTAAERSALIARARGLGWKDDEFIKFMKDGCGVDSTRDLTRAQFVALSQAVEDGPSLAPEPDAPGAVADDENALLRT